MFGMGRRRGGGGGGQEGEEEERNEERARGVHACMLGRGQVDAVRVVARVRIPLTYVPVCLRRAGLCNGAQGGTYHVEQA